VAIVSSLAPSSARGEEEVRIAVSAGRTKVAIEAHDLRVFDADVGDQIGRAEGKRALEVRVFGSGVEVEGLGLIGEHANPPLRAREVLFEASSGVRVDGKLFLGRVAIHADPGTKRLMAINRLPIETYLLGIVGSEMSPSWPLEALKAQAVAARTYALFRRMLMRAANQPYDLDSSVLSQVYLGADRIRPSVVQAVAETRGEVLSFHHRLVEALFHSTCGGTTVSAMQAFGRAVPYLTPRHCGFCNDSANYRWKMKLSLRELSTRLEDAHLIGGKIEQFEREAPEEPIDVKAGKKKNRLSAKAVRAAVGYTVLPSDRFVAETHGSSVEFEGRGFGHGVGLCQWGAHGLAVRGRGYKDIVSHYYAGAEVKRIY
jgi:stage II sporulation protein D